MDGCNGIDSHFGCFFQQPFDSVNIFGWGNCEVQFKGSFWWCGYNFGNLEHTVFFARIQKGCLHFIAFAVGKEEAVSGLIAKYGVQVAAFFLIQLGDAVGYLAGVEHN
jgi:hypothetical protein